MFDIVGDVHGCDDELVDLLAALGHAPSGEPPHPEGRRLVFVGDLVDRGPATPAVVARVMGLVAAGRALAVAGNHDVRLAEALRGGEVEPGHGLEESLEQMAACPEGFRARAAEFLGSLPAHLLLDAGRLVVAHAGLEEHLHGLDTPLARERAIHGAYTGGFDARPMPVRDDWAARYRGAAAVVQGHTPVDEAEWFHGTICIDTACVYGGRLTALRWPERTLVAVPARRSWAVSARGPLPPRRSAVRPVWRAPPVLGPPGEAVRLLRAEAAVRAARIPCPVPHGPFVVHLPPTMSSCDPAPTGGLPEHPLGAMSCFAAAGLRSVVCEEKHSGVRVIAVVCRDAETARRRFGARDGRSGGIHSRVGRPVVDPATEGDLVATIADAAAACGLWDELSGDWMCLDGEWLGTRSSGRNAPGLVLFHLLAAEGRTFFEVGHAGQLAVLGRLAASAPAHLRVTQHRSVDLERPTEVAGAIAWWHALGRAGGEGMVVKPDAPATCGFSGPVQPALKVRCPVWLEGVYAGALEEPGGIERFRARSLARKRDRALGQFALGVEALERFVEGRPRRDVDACLDALLGWAPEG